MPFSSVPCISTNILSKFRKTVQTLEGLLFIGGQTKECTNESCSHTGKHYYTSQAALISLPKSTYGLDVLAHIGWQHEHEHKQLVEIQRELNERGILIMSAIRESCTGSFWRSWEQ